MPRSYEGNGHVNGEVNDARLPFGQTGGRYRVKSESTGKIAYATLRGSRLTNQSSLAADGRAETFPRAALSAAYVRSGRTCRASALAGS